MDRAARAVAQRARAGGDEVRTRSQVETWGSQRVAVESQRAAIDDSHAINREVGIDVAAGAERGVTDLQAVESIDL